MWEEEDVDKNLAERDKILADAGVRFTKKYLMKAYGFEEEDIEITAPTKPVTSEFSEPDEKPKTFPDQKAIDDLIISFNDNELQSQFKDVLNPVLSFFNEYQDPNHALEKLSEIYPNMDSGELEKTLANLMFVAEVWGRLNA